MPLNHFVHQPKDEQLIDDDSLSKGRSNLGIVDNGGFTGSYTNDAQVSEHLTFQYNTYDKITIYIDFITEIRVTIFIII